MGVVPSGPEGFAVGSSGTAGSSGEGGFFILSVKTPNPIPIAAADVTKAAPFTTAMAAASHPPPIQTPTAHAMMAGSASPVGSIPFSGEFATYPYKFGSPPAN